MDTNGDGLGDTEVPYDSDGNIQAGGDFHPLTEEFSISCGMNLSSSLVLDRSLYCPANGITITSDDVVLDCNGLEIGGTYQGYGILVEGRENVTIRNCDIYHFAVGIKLNSSNGTNITSNRVYNNVFDNLYMESSDENRIASNIIYDDDIWSEGGLVAGAMELKGSNGNIIYNNKVHGPVHDDGTNT